MGKKPFRRLKDKTFRQVTLLLKLTCSKVNNIMVMIAKEVGPYALNDEEQEN